jgi:hypothetical protein
MEVRERQEAKLVAFARLVSQAKIYQGFYLVPVKAKVLDRFRLSCQLPGGIGAHDVFPLLVIGGSFIP